MFGDTAWLLLRSVKKQCYTLLLNGSHAQCVHHLYVSYCSMAVSWGLLGSVEIPNNSNNLPISYMPVILGPPQAARTASTHLITDATTSWNCTRVTNPVFKNDLSLFGDLTMALETSVYHITPKSSSAQPKCPCVVKSIASDLHHFHPYQIILVRRNMFCLCSPCKIPLPILKQFPTLPKAPCS